MAIHQHVRNALSVVLLLVVLALLNLLYRVLLHPVLAAIDRMTAPAIGRMIARELEMDIEDANRAAPTRDVQLRQHSLSIGAGSGPHNFKHVSFLFYSPSVGMQHWLVSLILRQVVTNYLDFVQNYCLSASPRLPLLHHCLILNTYLGTLDLLTPSE